MTLMGANFNCERTRKKNMLSWFLRPEVSCQLWIRKSNEHSFSFSFVVHTRLHERWKKSATQLMEFSQHLLNTHCVLGVGVRQLRTHCINCPQICLMRYSPCFSHGNWSPGKLGDLPKVEASGRTGVAGLGGSNPVPPSPPPLLWQMSQQPLHPTAQMASEWTRASTRWEGSLLAISQSLPRFILKNSKQYWVLNNNEKWIISRAALAQECSKEPYFPKMSTGEVLWSEELGSAAYYPSTACET